MTQQKNNLTVGSTIYPSAVSLALILTAVILSFVDLTFLNDVIGKILDFGTIESMVVAFALGLVGIAIMAHQGVKEAHSDEKVLSTIGHYMLWVSLGLVFVLIRLFSASILQLDNSFGDQSLIQLIGLNIRQIDLVLAPLMFFLYLTTGFMIKDGVKNLSKNKEYNNGWKAWIAARKAAKIEKARLAELTRLQRIKDQAEAKATEEAAKAAAEAAKIAKELKEALDREYIDALDRFQRQETKVEKNYQQISTNIDYVKGIKKDEKEFETKVKPGLLSIVQASIQSVQNNTALLVHKKTGEAIANLNSVIELHNDSRRKQQEQIRNVQNITTFAIHNKTNEDDVKLRSGRLIQ